MHTESRVGINKAESAAEACTQLNSLVPCEVHTSFLTPDNAIEVIKQYDIVVDASDNVATRYLVNDACVMLAKPLIYGSALRMEGQLTVFNYKGGPCYRCPPMRCNNWLKSLQRHSLLPCERLRFDPSSESDNMLVSPPPAHRSSRPGTTCMPHHGLP
jgi:molybdopterin/thiamine biosynthesis adenylyltransferase